MRVVQAVARRQRTPVVHTRSIRTYRIYLNFQNNRGVSSLEFDFFCPKCNEKEFGEFASLFSNFGGWKMRTGCITISYSAGDFLFATMLWYERLLSILTLTLAYGRLVGHSLGLTMRDMLISALVPPGTDQKDFSVDTNENGFARPK